MTDATIVIIIGAVQALGTAWISREVRKNACRGENCVKAIKEILADTNIPPAGQA